MLGAVVLCALSLVGSAVVHMRRGCRCWNDAAAPFVPRGNRLRWFGASFGSIR